MKNLLAILLLTVSTVACSEPAPTTTTTTTTTVPAPTEVVVEKKEVEQKKVCIKVWDAKLNKEVEKCKNMKIHEKHDGTKVPQ